VLYFLPEGIVPALRNWWRHLQHRRVASAATPNGDTR
jgi:hypothetical protein